MGSAVLVLIIGILNLPIYIYLGRRNNEGEGQVFTLLLEEELVSAMARPLRIHYPHAVYHVTARGNERKAIVQDDEDRQRFIQTVAAMVEQYQILCHAWVLMDNHYHLLIETPQANLSRAIRHLNGVYTQVHNRCHHVRCNDLD